MNWILVVIFGVGHYGYPAVIQQEFSTLEKCNSAREAMVRGAVVLPKSQGCYQK